MALASFGLVATGAALVVKARTAAAMRMEALSCIVGMIVVGCVEMGWERLCLQV